MRGTSQDEIETPSQQLFGDGEEDEHDESGAEAQHEDEEEQRGESGGTGWFSGSRTFW